MFAATDTRETDTNSLPALVTPLEFLLEAAKAEETKDRQIRGVTTRPEYAEKFTLSDAKGSP